MIGKKEFISQDLFDFDKSFNKKIIGTDEAGRGPGAGGVFASAVYFEKVTDKIITELSILNDSKKLTHKQREYLYDFVKNESVNETICIEVEEIEETNILACSLKAMKLACESVISKVGKKDILVIVDGNKLIRNFDYPQQFIIKGDGKSASIAGASILAKVTRDRYMDKLDEEFPQYGWKQNKGYMTKSHLEAVDKYGLTKYHRESFFRKHFEKQLTLF
jgi:ribonuclease HII